VRFRQIDPTDVPALFDVRVSTRENALSREELTGMGITEPSVTAMLKATHRGYLCEVDSRVVGFAMVNLSNGEMWVIAVLPAYEQQGVGTGLLARVEDVLWTAGWDEIWLTTDVDPSLRAYGFYRKQGWTDHQTKDGLRYMKKRNPGRAE
jgi:ribosomal protein S18 acetylase RimI-like enzyme